MNEIGSYYTNSYQKNVIIIIRTLFLFLDNLKHVDVISHLF